MFLYPLSNLQRILVPFLVLCRFDRISIVCRRIGPFFVPPARCRIQLCQSLWLTRAVAFD
uniref:Uncharacterized protein n=1 Tax=Anguilla anguilla TaxID=7936 RepID=A0A0E9SMP1_ANGAN